MDYSGQNINILAVQVSFRVANKEIKNVVDILFWWSKSIRKEIFNVHKIIAFFFAFLWTETKSRSIKMQTKKKRGQYPAILTEQAWSIKDLLYGHKITPTEFRFCGTNVGNPERAR